MGAARRPPGVREIESAVASRVDGQALAIGLGQAAVQTYSQSSVTQVLEPADLELSGGKRTEHGMRPGVKLDTVAASAAMTELPVDPAVRFFGLDVPCERDLGREEPASLCR